MPDGEVEHSQSRSSGFDVGASLTRDRTYLGASYVFDDSRHGVPLVEAGQTQRTVVHIPRKQGSAEDAEGRWSRGRHGETNTTGWLDDLV